MANHIVTMGGVEQGTNRHNISFGTHRDYTAEAKVLFASIPQYKHHIRDNDFIKNSKYYARAKDVLDMPSMGWAFKAIVIHDVLNEIEDNDLLLWCDSNHILAGDIAPIEKWSYHHNIFCHDHSPTYYPNWQWTHKDTFINMNCDESRYWNSPQMQVNIMAFVKNGFTSNFIAEWLKYCLIYDVIIGKNKHPDPPGFREHRHEQSIFSILREKYSVHYGLLPEGIFGEIEGNKYIAM